MLCILKKCFLKANKKSNGMKSSKLEPVLRILKWQFLEITRILPPGSRSAWRIPSTCSLLFCQTPPSWLVYSEGASKVFSGCTPDRLDLCCKTHRALPVHSEASLLRCSKSRSAASLWSSGETPGSTQLTRRSLQDYGDSVGARRGHRPCHPVSVAALHLSDWCFHRRKAVRLRGRRTSWNLECQLVGVLEALDKVQIGKLERQKNMLVQCRSL